MAWPTGSTNSAMRTFDSRYTAQPDGGCWLWNGTKKRAGYGVIVVGGRGPRRHYLAHRVSWERAFGAIPSGKVVCHKCDQPSCVNPAHLFLGTSADNVSDMVRKGRHAKGEHHGCAKVSEADVREIRSLHSGGMSQLGIARQFGISNSTIHLIVKGRLWAHVQ